MRQQTTLGYVLTGIEAGKSFQTSEILARHDELGVLKVSAVTWSAFRPDEAKAVLAYEPQEYHRVRRGDLLISRANTRELVGAVVLVEKDYPLRLLSDKTLRLNVDTRKADKGYLLYALRSDMAREHIEHFATGTSDSMRNIAQGVISSIPIRLPRLDEQRWIAAQLQEQLAAVEEARLAAQAQRNDAGLLEERIREQAFNVLLTDWPREQKLSDVCAISAGGTPSRGNPAYFQGDIPWVKTLDLNFGTVEDVEEKITSEAFRSIRAELLPLGTVMVAMYGGAGTIGKSGVLGLAACTNQAVCALQPRREELDSQFLHEWIRYVRSEWMKLAGGNRKDPNINKSIVEAMTLPLPPLAVQIEFRSRLRAQLAEACTIVDATNQQLAEIELLPSRLLAQAFGTPA